jgi:hypothetical protein
MKTTGTHEGDAKVRLRLFLALGLLMAALTACGGPGETDTALSDALATATTLVPPGAEETAQAIAADPTVAALTGELEAALADPQLEAALDQAFAAMNDQVVLAQGEALALDALAQIENIQSYRLTVVDAPAGAGVTPNTTIKEGTGANITLTPEEYAQHFTVAGDYTMRLDITNTENQTASHEFVITVP